jgi:hypothetical protein
MTRKRRNKEAHMAACLTSVTKVRPSSIKYKSPLITAETPNAIRLYLYEEVVLGSWDFLSKYNMTHQDTNIPARRDREALARFS